MEKITVQIHTEKVLGKVPKYFFGHFIEFMYDCIDPGMWAELLASRGFEQPGKEGVSAPWKSVGKEGRYHIDTETVYAPYQSQKVERDAAAKGAVGIEQSGLFLHPETVYEGCVWAKSLSPVDACVRIVNNAGAVLFFDSFTVQPGEWHQHGYVFANKNGNDDIKVQYLVKSEGAVWFDQASLRPQNAICGIWPQVLQKIKALRPSILRFPGGCVADCYFWREGVGARDQRPSRPNLHWGGIEQNNFGTDEYIALCRELKAEPLICVNFGSSTPEDAANWVEYCNGDARTEFGALRAAHGHPEPYGVTYWDIGNEAFAPWEIGYCTADEYSEKYSAFARAMKQKDASICLLSCGGDGNRTDQSWNRTILENAGRDMDVLTLHMYAPLIGDKKYNDEHLYRSVAAMPYKFERVLQESRNSIQACGLPIKIGVTEWNCNYGESNSDREQTLEAAIANAGMLNLFFRYSDMLEMCNVSDLVNGWPGGIVRSRKGNAVGTATYHVLKMYAQNPIEYVVDCRYNSESYATGEVGNIPSMGDIPYVDIVCGRKENGRVAVFAINRHLEEKAALELPGTVVSRQQVWHEDVWAKNEFDGGEIVSIDNKEPQTPVILPPHSVSCIELSFDPV